MAAHSLPLRLLLAAVCFHSAATLQADEPLVLANQVVQAQWTLDAGQIAALTLTNEHTDQTIRLKTGYHPIAQHARA